MADPTPPWPIEIPPEMGELSFAELPQHIQAAIYRELRDRPIVEQIVDTVVIPDA